MCLHCCFAFVIIIVVIILYRWDSYVLTKGVYAFFEFRLYSVNCVVPHRALCRGNKDSLLSANLHTAAVNPPCSALLALVLSFIVSFTATCEALEGQDRADSRRNLVIPANGE